MIQLNEKIVEVANVSIRYGQKTVVDDLSFVLSRGQSLGLLGLNGAGKSTTIRSLLGMIHPFSGKVSVFNEKPGKINGLKQVGFAPEDGVPPDFLTVEEYLRFSLALKMPNSKKKESECVEAFKSFELDPKKSVQDLSKGMNRRLVLAQAFLGNPSLLILDEPLNGLDPLMIIKLRDKIENYRKEGGTVLYCSHILSEVEKSCSDIIILREGKASYRGSVVETKTNYGEIEVAFAKHAGIV